MSEQIECSRAEAAALETVYGILAEPQCFYIERTGGAGQTFQVREKVQEAQAALAAARDPDSPPEHPFLACLYAIEAHETLSRWQLLGERMQFVRTAGRLCRLIGRPAIAAAPSIAAFRVADMRHAAALVVCGFEPQNWIAGEVLALSFAGASVSFPDLPREAIRAAAEASFTRTAPGIDASKVVLGNFPAGEHPWCYAIQALANDGAVRLAMREAKRDPIVMTRGRGERCSVASMSLLESSCPDASLRDAVRRHNKGLPP